MEIVITFRFSELLLILLHTHTHNHNHTVESPNKGHFGTNSFVPRRKVVPISEGPLSEVPLCILLHTMISNLLLHGRVCVSLP